MRFKSVTGENDAAGQIALPEECLPPGPWQHPSAGFHGPPPLGREALAAPTGDRRAELGESRRIACAAGVDPCALLPGKIFIDIVERML